MTTTAAPFRQDLRKLADPGLLGPHLQARTQRGGAEGTPWAIVVPYIDARGAAAILDEALGVAGWGFAFHTPPTKRQGGQGFGAVGRLTLYIDLPGGGVREVIHEDIGAGGDDSMETGAKGAASDSLKRCAAQAGVGRLLGRLGEVKVNGSDVYVNRKGKAQAKDAAVERVIRGFRDTLKTWADAWAAKAPDAIPEVPATGDGHDDEREPEPPVQPAEAASPPDAPASAPVEPPASPSDESAADESYKAAQAATGSPLPPAPEGTPPGESGVEPPSPMEAAIHHLGAPPLSADWNAKAAWVREQLGDTDTKVAQNDLGVRYLSAVQNAETYAKFLNYIMERQPVTTQEAA